MDETDFDIDDPCRVMSCSFVVSRPPHVATLCVHELDVSVAILPKQYIRRVGSGMFTLSFLMTSSPPFPSM